MFLPNSLGSTTLLTDSSGNSKQSYQYSPFGALLNSPTDNNPFQFTGRENDGDGLLYYRARYYNPNWGRFVSADPLGFGGGINPYVYAEDNPVNATDPSGRIHVVVSITPSSTPNTGREGTAKVFLNKGDVYEGTLQSGGELVLTFPVSNNVSNPTGNPWTPEANTPIPNGTFTLGPVNEPPNNPTSEGPAFIYIGNGMGKGLHGQHGTLSYLSPTNGCIRTDNGDLLSLIAILNNTTSSVGNTITIGSTAADPSQGAGGSSPDPSQSAGGSSPDPSQSAGGTPPGFDGPPG